MEALIFSICHCKPESTKSSFRLLNLEPLKQGIAERSMANNNII